MNSGRSYVRVESRVFAYYGAFRVCACTAALVLGLVSIYLLLHAAVGTHHVTDDVMFLSYAAPGTPAPLILDLHGAGALPAHQWSVSHMQDCARDRGWHIVYPAGVGNTWNAGPGMYPPAWSEDSPTDHVAEISKMASELRSALNASRVFVTGLSNGCAMALRLGLEAADGVIDAVTCTAHAMNADIRPRTPPVARPMLLLTGTEDPVFASGTDVNRTLYQWAQNNGCANHLVSMPAADGDTTVQEFVCASAVRHVLFHGAGHILPLARASDMQCEFLAQWA